MTEIKYKDTVISVEAGQTATLHTTDKKLTGDIEVTAPAESGGGLYSIDWDISNITSNRAYVTFCLPSTIAYGQKVYAVIASSGDDIYVESSSNCDIQRISQYSTSNINNKYVAWIATFEVSNPTGDISIVLDVGGTN